MGILTLEIHYLGGQSEIVDFPDQHRLESLSEYFGTSLAPVSRVEMLRYLPEKREKSAVLQKSRGVLRHSIKGH